VLGEIKFSPELHDKVGGGLALSPQRNKLAPLPPFSRPGLEIGLEIKKRGSLTT